MSLKKQKEELYQETGDLWNKCKVIKLAAISQRNTKGHYEIGSIASNLQTACEEARKALFRLEVE